MEYLLCARPPKDSDVYTAQEEGAIIAVDTAGKQRMKIQVQVPSAGEWKVCWERRGHDGEKDAA